MGLRLRPEYQAMLDAQLPKKEGSVSIEEEAKRVAVSELIDVRIAVPASKYLTKNFVRVTSVTIQIFWSTASIDWNSYGKSTAVLSYTALSNGLLLQQNKRNIFDDLGLSGFGIRRHADIISHAKFWSVNQNIGCATERTVLTAVIDLAEMVGDPLGIDVTKYPLELLVQDNMTSREVERDIWIFNGWTWG